jgi:hypothetical protein
VPPTTGGRSSLSPTSLAASGPADGSRAKAPTRPVGVELLKDIRLAFGEDDAIRSIGLVGKLIADPERPWVRAGEFTDDLTWLFDGPVPE